MWWKVVVTLVAVVTVGALVVGCSSDDDSSAPAPTSTGGATTATVALPTSFPAPTGPPCATESGGSLVVTVTCVDPELGTAPYVDIDEQRTTTDPDADVTVEYRYVHGGFTDTDVRFSFYFPSADAYQGRFFESTYPTITTEDAADATVAFAIANGAYVVSSNNAGGVAASPTLGGYRANAAAAKFSRVIAAELYGADAPVRGYIYGGSGGAYQTLASAENTDGVWQGAVPIVPGVPNSIPSFMSVQVLALRLLADEWPNIVDAMEPGGSGDPYATLDADERAVLEEATQLGHPLRGWWQWESLRGGAFSLVVPAVTGVDGSYVDDFFSLPGYEGSDPDVAAARVQFDTTVAAVDGDPTATVTLAGEPQGYLQFVDLVVTSGASAGTTIPLVTLEGAQVTLAADAGPEARAAFEALAPGDAVRIDNSLYLALSYYHRHQVPSADQYGWNQFRGTDGQPVPVQRPVLVGEVLSDVFGGKATGRFNGKMIMLSSVLDVQAYPWSADWYRTQATAALGDDLEDSFRLWYLDNADHTMPTSVEGRAHIVSYDAEVQQALLDLDAWVLDGTPPPASSTYTVSEDTQVSLAAAAAERGGIQPVLSFSVSAGEECGASDGAVRVDVGAGDPVAFDLRAEMPPGTGEIVRVEWDFDGTGEFPEGADLDESSTEVDQCESHTYDEPGTYFAVARVTSQRDGDPSARFGLVQNLARVRVVVEGEG